MNGSVEAIRGQCGNFLGPERVWIKPQQIGGLAVSRSFGDISYRCVGVNSDAEITYRKIVPLDKFIVLASDGVWDQMTNDEVVSMVWASLRNGSTAKNAARAVVNLARKKWQVAGGGYIDDITVLIVLIG